MTEHAPELNAPAPDVLADEHDEDGWDVDQHGRMVQFATADDAVVTVPYEEG